MTFHSVRVLCRGYVRLAFSLGIIVKLTLLYPILLRCHKKMPFALWRIKLLYLGFWTVEFLLTIILYLQILKALNDCWNPIIVVSKARRGFTWPHVTIILVFNLGKLRHKLRAPSISWTLFLSLIVLVLIDICVALAELLCVRILNLVCHNCCFWRFYCLRVWGLFLATKCSWLSRPTPILSLFRRGSIREPGVLLRFAWEGHN